MSDTATPMGTEKFVMRAQYIRDFSFENANPIAAFTMDENNQPSFSVSVQAKAQDLGEKNYEVVLDLRIDASQGEDQIFIAELSYAGIVSLTDKSTDADVESIIMVQVPYLLFPFARAIIADVIRESGYPPLLLAPVDFATLLNQKKAEDAQPTQH